MHLPIPEQGRWLASVLQGHCNYYAVPDNNEALRRLPLSDHPALARGASASQPAPRLTWERMELLADRWLPLPRILHPWPEQRFAAITQGRSRVRENRTHGVRAT